MPCILLHMGKSTGRMLSEKRKVISNLLSCKLCAQHVQQKMFCVTKAYQMILHCWWSFETSPILANDNTSIRCQARSMVKKMWGIETSHNYALNPTLVASLNPTHTVEVRNTPAAASQTMVHYTVRLYSISKFEEVHTIINGSIFPRTCHQLHPSHESVLLPKSQFESI